ncbi:SDR family oxidoreductase [Lacihabitans sp. LS3-19]|uniref:SDR family oxidoreductase n=1 Tax=Lacihabitans sp. LS3-19 TaxID=2487335 RepID=UPI0020CF2A4A|nr:SDR family oxidoreductase [Lacihabitans sp. LS3-19]MCP9770456.1 SDR family oxidoreductase [Lacihabitans sp. LS3-19]
MILITGATGQLGRGIIENLLKTTPSSEITAFVRDETKAADLKALGVTLKVGTYQDSDSLEAAMSGIDKVLLISSADFVDRIGQHKNVINAAKKAGVKQIFYTGVSIKDMDASPIKPMLGDHFETEDYIKELGFDYTFLRNALYFDIIPMFAGEGVFENGIFFPAEKGKVAFALRSDLAEATALIINSADNVNKVYNLAGSTAYSFEEIAAELSKLSGKEVGYLSPEPEAFEGMLKQFGVPDIMIILSQSFAGAFKHNDFEETSTTLYNILGRETVELAEFLKSNYKL